MSDRCAACNALFVSTLKATFGIDGVGVFDTDLCTRCVGDALLWAAKMARSEARDRETPCAPCDCPTCAARVVGEPLTPGMGLEKQPEPEKPLPGMGGGSHQMRREGESVLAGEPEKPESSASSGMMTFAEFCKKAGLRVIEASGFPDGFVIITNENFRAIQADALESAAKVVELSDHSPSHTAGDVRAMKPGGGEVDDYIS